jgi:hypothetical protein
MGMIREEYPPITARLGFMKQLSQTIKEVLPILVVSKYLSTLYPPDHDMVHNTRSLPEAGKRQDELILAYIVCYHDGVGMVN